MKSRAKHTDDPALPLLDPDAVEAALDWPSVDEAVADVLAASLSEGVGPDAGMRRRLATLRRPRTASFSGPVDPKRHPQD